MGDTYLISGLTAKRAEVSGIVAELEKRIAQHRADIVHIDAILRLCAPDVVPKEIVPRPASTSSTSARSTRSECFAGTRSSSET